MRFIVIAAERAPTIATMIQRICRTVGKAAAGARRQKRAHQRKRKRKYGVLELDHFEHGAEAAFGHMTRDVSLPLTFRACSRATLPAILLVLRQSNLREHAAGKLFDDVVTDFGP